MATVFISMDQGVNIVEMPTPTTVRGIIGISAVANGLDPSGFLADITLPIAANRVAWRAALVDQINAWALENGHVVTGILWPDLELT